MVDTARTLITDVLLDLGVLADEQTPTASQAQGMLRKLTNLISAWNIEGLLLYGNVSYTLPLVGNKQVYTIGVGGDLNVPYPNEINSAYIRDTSLPVANQVDYPMYIYNDQEWADMPFKGQTGQWPNWGVWFNYMYPLVQMTIAPIPTSSQYELILWVDSILGDVTLDTVLSYPPGYKRALESNLAVEAAASYGVEVPDTIAKIAVESKAAIKVKNLQINELSSNYGGGWYDIRSNRYLR